MHTDTSLRDDLREVLTRHGYPDTLDAVMETLDTEGVFDKTWTEEEE